jgi:hypothetical protein
MYWVLEFDSVKEKNIHVTKVEATQTLYKARRFFLKRQSTLPDFLQIIDKQMFRGSNNCFC